MAALIKCKNCGLVSEHITEKCTRKREKTANGKEKPFKCLAFGCVEDHMYHYCPICDNVSSNHRIRDCPFKKDTAPQALPASPASASAAAKQMKCRAPDCSENHARHYCGYCKMEDSNHRSSKCPKRESVAERQGREIQEQKRQEELKRQELKRHEELTRLMKKETENKENENKQKKIIEDSEKKIIEVSEQQNLSISRIEIQIELRQHIIKALTKLVELKNETKDFIDHREFEEQTKEEIKKLETQIIEENAIVKLDQGIKLADTVENKIDKIQIKIEFLDKIIANTRTGIRSWSSSEEILEIENRIAILETYKEIEMREIKQLNLEKLWGERMDQQKLLSSASASAAAAMPVAPKVIPKVAYVPTIFDDWNSDAKDAIPEPSPPSPSSPPSGIDYGVDIRNGMRTHIASILGDTIYYITILDNIIAGAAVVGYKFAQDSHSIYDIKIIQDKGKPPGIMINIPGQPKLCLGVHEPIFDRGPVCLKDIDMDTNNIVWNYEKHPSGGYYIYISVEPNTKFYLSFLGDVDARNRSPLVVVPSPPPYRFYFVPLGENPQITLSGGSIKNYYHNKNLYKLLQHN